MSEQESNTLLDTLESNENPSDEEYKRMKRTMAIMVNFYRNGADKKREQAEAAEAELEKLEGTLCMCRVQLGALMKTANTVPPNIYKFADEQPTTAPVPKPKKATRREITVPGRDGYQINGENISVLTEKTPEVVTLKEHPRIAEYRERLEREMETLEKEKPDFQKRAKEYRLLHEWSKGIVRAMEWLESNLDEYCESVLGLKPTSSWAKKKEKVVLTPEQVEEYRKGLQEVTYNLQESQDFFEASLDGRLHAFLTIEKDAIEAQLAAVRKFPESLERRKLVEDDLVADLESVTESLAVPRERNQHMTDMHRDFWAVLLWQKEILQNMGIVVNPPAGHQ